MDLSREELARYNGKNGNPAYVTYKGKIYDVSGSFLWKNGNHEALYNAGADLTDAMEQSPHGGDALEKFPVVGSLQDTRTDSGNATDHIRAQKTRSTQ
jgi:predicted heme/steroid binding protein